LVLRCCAGQPRASRREIPPTARCRSAGVLDAAWATPRPVTEVRIGCGSGDSTPRGTKVQPGRALSPHWSRPCDPGGLDQP
jgi:hypothetical protein